MGIYHLTQWLPCEVADGVAPEDLVATVTTIVQHITQSFAANDLPDLEWRCDRLDKPYPVYAITALVEA